MAIETMSAPPLAGSRLSPQQRRLWLLPGGSACRVRRTLLLEGPLDEERLRRAVCQVTARHEILRTAFRGRPGMSFPLQVVGATAEPRWERTDLMDLKELPGEEEPGPDLSTGSPARWVLASLGEGRYALRVSLPALCGDARSLDLLNAEVARLYGGGPEPADEPLQYADFAQWWNDLLEAGDEEAEQGKEAWQRWSPADLEAVALPCERTDGSGTPRPAAVPLELPPDAAARAAEVGRRCGAAPEHVLFAVWQIWLGRMTGRPQGLTGWVFDGRGLEDIAESLGPIARTLPVLAPDPRGLRFDELVKRVRRQVERSAEWADYGISEASGWEAPVRFPAVFEHGACSPEWSAGGLSWFFLDQWVAGERCKLKLSCWEVGGVWRASLGYDADLFAVGDVQRFARQLASLAARTLAEPDLRVDDLELADEEDLRAWRGLEAPASTQDEGGWVHERIARWACEDPGRRAVAAPDGELSYGELESRANRLASYLRRLGAGPEERVVFCLDRSLDLIVALLAVLKTGAAYLPLDPSSPATRLQRLAELSGARLVLAHRRFGEGLSGSGLTRIELDLDRGRIAAEPDTPLDSQISGASLAYVLFTSGSTGRPKAVAVEHRQLVHYLEGVLPRLQAPDGASFAMVSSLAADLGNTAIFPALCTGGCLHLPAQARLTDPEAMAEYSSSHGLGVLKIVPSHLDAWLTATEPQRVLPQATLVLGGEALRWSLVDRLRELGAGRAFLNHYGPTEATVGVLTYPIADDRDRPYARTVPLGWPLQGSRVRILDEQLRLVPIGVTGELHIGGGGLARGYLGEPAATAERFFPDPFAEQPGERLYRTGDRARILPGGAVEFLGRVDHQVKIRGFRLELGEIEHALARHPAVREAVVVLREDRPGDIRLAAYLVPRAGERPLSRELRAFLRDRLPDFMIPSAVVVLDALPLTANGKVDRNALPAPDVARQSESQGFIEPRTPVEKALAQIWEEVLGVERVGLHDNFFELGGDSILIIQVVARTNRLGLRLTPRLFFERQTVAELAEAAASGATEGSEQGPAQGEVPLTPIQRWFFERGFADPHHWNQAVLLELVQPLDPERLAAAVGDLARHHDALRLRFQHAEDGWRQTYGEPSAQAPFLRIDLSALPASAVSGSGEGAAEEVQASLDLVNGPLFRAVLFHLGGGERDRLLLVAHHLVVDGVSWRVLREDLVAAYRVRGGDGIGLPPKTTSFQAWARRLVEHSRSGVLEPEAELWSGLAEAEGLALPRDLAGGRNTVASQERITVFLAEDETKALLQEAPGAYRAQINELLLAALVEAFAPWTGRWSLLLEMEGHGREDLFEGVDLSRTVGWFTTHFPIHLDLTGVAGRGERVARVQEELRRIPHRGLGFGLLLYLGEGDAAARLRTLPRPEVSFNYLGQLDGTPAEGALFQPSREAFGSTRSLRGERRYLLEVVCSIAAGRFQSHWRYSRDLHHAATVDGLAKRFAEALRGLAARASAAPREASLSDFPLAHLSREQLEKIARRLGQAGKTA